MDKTFSKTLLWGISCRHDLRPAPKNFPELSILHPAIVHPRSSFEKECGHGPRHSIPKTPFDTIHPLITDHHTQDPSIYLFGNQSRSRGSSPPTYTLSSVPATCFATHQPKCPPPDPPCTSLRLLPSLTASASAILSFHSPQLQTHGIAPTNRSHALQA